MQDFLTYKRGKECYDGVPENDLFEINFTPFVFNTLYYLIVINNI